MMLEANDGHMSPRKDRGHTLRVDIAWGSSCDGSKMCFLILYSFYCACLTTLRRLARGLVEYSRHSELYSEACGHVLLQHACTLLTRVCCLEFKDRSIAAPVAVRLRVSRRHENNLIREPSCSPPQGDPRDLFVFHVDPGHDLLPLDHRLAVIQQSFRNVRT